VDALYPFTAAHDAIQEACRALLAAQGAGRGDAARDRSRARDWLGMAEDQLRGLAYPEACLVVAPPEDTALFHERLGVPWSTGVQTLEAFQALRTSALTAGSPEELVQILAQLRTLIPRRHPDLLTAETAAIRID
jgi:hypothetical protein